MKANELMIGDWMIGGSGEQFKIGIIDPDFLYWNDIKPIPLTPEILEKNGMKPFDIDKLTEKATAKWWHKGGDFFIKQYHFKHHNFKPTYSFGCGNHTLIEGIEYVHQLQHALRLCGIDKTIEL